MPFHPRLCKLHLLKRKVLQYVASFRGKRDGGWDGALFLLLPSSYWVTRNNSSMLAWSHFHLLALLSWIEVELLTTGWMRGADIQTYSIHEVNPVLWWGEEEDLTHEMWKQRCPLHVCCAPHTQLSETVDDTSEQQVKYQLIILLMTMFPGAAIHSLFSPSPPGPIGHWEHWACQSSSHVSNCPWHVVLRKGKTAPSLQSGNVGGINWAPFVFCHHLACSKHFSSKCPIKSL